MYNLNNVDGNAHDIIGYVKACMKEKKCGSTEIREYEKQAKMYDYTHLLNVSQEYIDMLNQMEQQQECKVTYI